MKIAKPRKNVSGRVWKSTAKLGPLAISRVVGKNIANAKGRCRKPYCVRKPFWREAGWEKRCMWLKTRGLSNAKRTFSNATKGELWRVVNEAQMMNLTLWPEDCVDWEYGDMMMMNLALDCELNYRCVGAKLKMMRRWMKRWPVFKTFAGQTDGGYDESQVRARFILEKWEGIYVRINAELGR